MKQTVNEHDFIDAFRDYDRYDNFGYEALKALFKYLEEYERDCDTEIELDVIALCCEFCQYDSAAECAKEMLSDSGREEDEDDEDYETRMLEELRENTTVIEYDGGIIVQSF